MANHSIGQACEMVELDGQTSVLCHESDVRQITLETREPTHVQTAPRPKPRRRCAIDPVMRAIADVTVALR